jgi:hypothetical protein
MASGGAVRNGQLEFLESERNGVLDVVARAVAGDTIAGTATEQFVGGRFEGLADDVPQGVVHRADRVYDEPFSAVVQRAPPHDVPQALDLKRVLADE